MRKLKQSLLLGLGILMCAYSGAYARSCTVNVTQLPINNFSLSPGCDMMVSFEFPKTINGMYCVADGPAGIGYIAWPFRGKMYSSTLPITLYKDAAGSRFAIDPRGKFMIRNTLGRVMVINCIYG